METKAKLPKKLLSMFLAMLMIFSACYVGIDGAYTAYAAAGDSAYTEQQVADLIKAAINTGNGYYASKSSGNATNITGDDGRIIAAAEAIYDYAIKTYREGKKFDSDYNSSDTLCNKFVADFGKYFPNNDAEAYAALYLVTDVLNPNGTTLYGYPQTITNKSARRNRSRSGLSYPSNPVGEVGQDVSTASDIAGWFNANVKDISKSVSVTVDLEKYLLRYPTIDDIPTTIIRSISYTYNHTVKKYAVVTSYKDGESGSFLNKTRYTDTYIDYGTWNYMSAKPTRLIEKDKATKKQLLAYEKYFTAERLATTREALLEMDFNELLEIYNEAVGYRDAIVNDFSKNIINHFGLNYDGIIAYVDLLDFVIRARRAMNGIDDLVEYIGDEYNKDSYAEMAELYTKVNTAYEDVKGMKDDVKTFIIDEMGYAEKYNTVQDMMADAEAYISELRDIMREQRLEELVAAMVAKYNQYNGKLDKENVKEPTDPEIIGLKQFVNSSNNVLAGYVSESYYDTYFPADYRTAWNEFSALVDDVYEVRGLKDEFKTYYDYFLPILFTDKVVDLSNEDAMAMYDEAGTKLEELRTEYNNVYNKYGEKIADGIYTLNYNGSDSLLQTVVENQKGAGLNEIKRVLIARTEAMLDAVYNYKDITEVNFSNFADIKSTLSKFDQNLYDYVNAKGWLTNDYTGKYGEVANLLNKYHVFSQSDGEAYFDKNFTFADENGNYADRLAGDQTIKVPGEDENGNPVEIDKQVGYPNDIVRDNEDNNGDGKADDDYTVKSQVMEDTVKRIDGFLAHRDFGALLGFVDEETEEPTDLKTYINQMINNSLFTSDLINSLVALIYPMVADLLETELPNALADLGTPNDPGASAAIDVGSLVDALGGTLNIYIDDDEKTLDDNYKGRNQRYLYEVFESAGLYIYPRSFAKYLNISNPAEFKAGNELYDALMKADRSWKYFTLTEDLKDENGKVIKEAGEIHIGYDWGINGDRDKFIESISYIFDSILPLLQVLMLGTDFSEELSNAAYVWGYVDVPILGDQQLGGYGNLTLNINCKDVNGNSYSVWNSVIVPLFRVLGVENIPALKAGFEGYDLSEALLGTLLRRVDEILSSPLDSILSILPNLVYFLSMDTVQEVLDNLNININLGIGVEIESGDSGAIGDIIGWLGNDVLDFLDNLTSFDLALAVADLIEDEGGLYGLLGFEITNFNELLKMVTPLLGEGITLPTLKQEEIMFCADFTRRSDGSVNLIARKGDLLFWFVDFLVAAIGDGSILAGLLGDNVDPMVSAIITKVTENFANNKEDAIAAFVELLNPVTYDLKEIDWVESQFNYGEPEILGANNMSAVYLYYGNDWTEESANALVDEIDGLVASILEMVEMDLGDAENLGGFLADKVNGLFTNDNITALVKMLGGLGDSPSAVINDVIDNQIGINIAEWFTAFGYLFPADTWKEDAEVILPDTRQYVNDFGVDGVANEDGTITWILNGRQTLVDGDGYTFINILVRLLGPAELVLKFLLAGEDISAFTDVVTLKGYETYESTFGLLLEGLGVQNLPSQADFHNDTMGAFSQMLTAVLDWFYALTSSEDMIAQILELIPDLFYYIESNGLSVLLHNLLMPVWVLVDTIRPILDVDVNGLLSIILSEVLNGGTINIEGIIQYLLNGTYQVIDPEFKTFHIEIANLRLSDIIQIFDGYLGTNLYDSGLVQIGIKGFCSGVEEVNSPAVGTYCRTTVTAADAITLLVTALVDCLSYPSADPAVTNGDAIFAFIAEKTENEKIANLYPAILAIIEGVEPEYLTPDWGYMFSTSDEFTVNLPKPTIEYLDYTTDWTEETADDIYAALDDILEMVLPEVLEEGETLATLINGILNDKVYSDELLTSLVETVVNLLADFHAFFGLVDGLLGTSVETWFAKDFCELQDVVNEETGETEQKWVCVKDFGIDAAAESDKKDLFIAGLKEVLAPVYPLLDWLLFGGSYEFFTGSETNTDGEYVYNDLITLNGGEGYAHGLAPIFEALGLGEEITIGEGENAVIKKGGMQNFTNTSDALDYIFAKVFGLIDSLASAESTVQVVFDLLPNLIYFINAGGLVTSVNNLLAPVNSILEAISPIIAEEGSTETLSLGGLLSDAVGVDICNLTMENILGLVTGLVEGLNIPDAIQNAIKTLYVGNLYCFTAANGDYAYRLDITGAEGDVLTLVLALAIELFSLNGELFEELLGEEVYTQIVAVLNGIDVKYTEIDWAYMYSTEAEKQEFYAADEPKFPEQTIDKLGYTTDWTEETAEDVYDALKPVVDMLLPELLGENESLYALIEGLLNDKVYTDETANALIELIVNAIAGLDESIIAIIDAADSILGADVSVWFSMCEINEETGEYECTEEWGIDDAEDPQTAFINAVKTVITPANDLLAWLFFADSYTFFDGVTKETLLTINGGEGYANALVPLLEAIGCTMQPKSAFYSEETEKYNVGEAIESILKSVLKFAEKVSADPIEEVFNLLPNLIYFINAGGVKAVVNNLLAPVDSVLMAVKGLIGKEIKIGDLLVDAIGFNISDITTASLLQIARDNGVVISDEIEDLVCNLFVGAPKQYDSVSELQNPAYRVDITDVEHDILTIVLTIALDIFNANDALFADLLTEETYLAVKTLLKGLEVEYMDIDWAYMYEGIEGGATAIEQLKTNGFPEATFSYLDYSTDWTPDAAAGVYEALDDILELVLPSVLDGKENLKVLVEGILNDNVYSDAVLISVVELIVNALADFDKDLCDGVGALLSADIGTWFLMCEKVLVFDAEDDAEDEYEYKVTDETIFLVDEATTPEAKKEAFIDGLQKVLAPANELLNWLLFGGSYTFLNSTEKNEDGTNKVLITINGGEGYNMALVPLLEALGCVMPEKTEFINSETNEYDAGLAVEGILTSVLGLLDKLVKYDTTVEFAFTLIPNLIYFINAGGAKAVVNNLIAPVSAVLECLSGVVDVNIGELLKEFLGGLDITNLTTDALLGLATANGVVLTADGVDLAEVIKGLYVGEVEEFVGANGNAAFKVDIEGSEYDVLTVLLGFAIDLFKLNKDLFAGLLPDGAYDQIIALINGITVTYNQINWAYMYGGDFAKLDAQGFPSKTIEKLPYTKDWTEEAAQGVYDALDPLADMLLPEFLGEGSLLDLLMGVLNDEVFTDKTANALIELIVNAIAGLDDTIITIIQSADSILGADVSVWFSMCDYNEETGKYECTEEWGIDGAADPKAEFIKAVKTVIAPANDLLSWLFFADSYTFFDGETKTPLITINGGEGYANALVPLLEAIGCTMQPKSNFYVEATKKYDVGAAIESILDSVLDFAAEVSANPVEEVFNLLPNLIYFINAGGVKAVVNNLLAPVDSVLNSIKGLVGEISIGKLLYDAVGFDVSEITTATLLQIARDNGVEISEDIEKLVCELAVGTPKPYDSVSGLDKPAYRVDITGAEGEILTIILALALDIFTTNKALFADLLGEAEYEAVIKLISGAASGVNWNYTEIDWGYMYAGNELADRLQALENANGYLPKYPVNSTAANYLLYGNNWNKETAVYVNQVIDAVVAGIMEDTSLGQMLDNAITNGLYQDSILNSLLESVVGLIVDYAEIIENAGALLGAESISKWFYNEETGEGYVKIVDGEAVCVHDFGIDEAKTNAEKRTLFVEAFVDVLEPAYRLLAWLLFGEDFEFLSGTTGAPLITLTGGQGYAKGFAPLLEALGATMPGVDGTYVNGKSGIKPASAYYDENGVLDMETAVRDIFTALSDWLYKICGDLQNPGELGTIGAMLELLPNVIYNINAGTLKAVVSNLLLPVEEILGHLEAFGLEVDFETLVEIDGQPLNIKDIDWYDVFDIVASLVNLYWPPEIEEFLATLYVGKAVAYESASGETGYYMTYNPDDTDTNYLISGREDMITLLISFVIDGALDPRNEAQLTDWLGADVYNVIYKYLSKDITPVDMQKFDWQLTEYAGTGEVLSPVTLGAVINSEFYGTLYTREMGQYIEKWLPSFVDTMIVLLGVQAEDGTNFEGLEDVLNELIGTSLYTKANLQAILDAIKGLIPTLKEELGAELFDVIVNVLDKALGIDLTYFDTYTIADFADGDREAFVNGLVNMFEPLEPILKWLLTGEDLIALFHTADGSDAVVIEGAEGYAYGIIPLLEAFDYEGNILTPDEFEAQAEDTAAMLKNVLNPILDVVDKVLADPVNEIFNVLPGIIYFLNSNGLDTVIRNVLNAVLVVLKNIEPLTDGLTVEDIYEMIGFNAAEINIDTLLDELLQGLEEDTGFQLEDVAMEAIKELTLGEVISFTSKNGDQAYTMKYVTGADRVDMVTVVLRTALTFISIPENVVALEAMLEGELDGEGYKFVCSLLENFSQMAASEGGMDEIMYTVYHIFYAANVAAHSTEDWLAEFNGDYSFLNQLFETSDLAFLRQLEASLGDLLNKYTGDIIDDNEIVPNGFIAFFQKIAEFFKKIGEFFANLFK